MAGATEPLAQHVPASCRLRSFGGIRTPLHAALGLLMLLCTQCAELSAGRQYTMAKVDADQARLMPVTTVVHDGDGAGESGDYDRPVGTHLGIVLSGGYLRYLSAVDRPEVLIYARVKIFPKDLNGPPLIWERIYLQTEDESEQLLLNEDSFLPRRDIPILPAFRYEGQDVVVSLRIVELDQDDNERLRKLVSTAAATAASFAPQTAPTISAAQAVMNFIVANNADDIEFQYDFAISPSGETLTLPADGKYGGTKKVETVLQPRVTTYVVVKTEHRDRLVFPPTWFGMVDESVRYTLAQGLKVGTLGLLNWKVWNIFGADPEGDAYLRLLGSPFEAAPTSWCIPEWDRGSADALQAVPELEPHRGSGGAALPERSSRLPRHQTGCPSRQAGSGDRIVPAVHRSGLHGDQRHLSRRRGRSGHSAHRRRRQPTHRRAGSHGPALTRAVR